MQIYIELALQEEDGTYTTVLLKFEHLERARTPRNWARSGSTMSTAAYRPTGTTLLRAEAGYAVDEDRQRALLRHAGRARAQLFTFYQEEAGSQDGI